MLSEEAQQVIDQELVLVVSGDDRVLYPHEQFIGAMQCAMLARMVALLPTDATVRHTYKALAAMRTVAGHKATLVEALARLQRSGVPVSPEEVTPGQCVVACFPVT